MLRWELLVLSILLCVIGVPEDSFAKESLPSPQKISRTLGEVSIGCANAPIVIIEYSSFTCTHCADFHKKILPQLKNYIDTCRVRYVMRNFPLDAFALKAAQLAYACGEKEYPRIAEVIFKRQKEWIFSSNPEESLLHIAKLCGISDEDADKCLKNQALIKDILNQRLEAQNSLNISTTPTFIINGKKIEGYIPFEQMENYIQDAENSEISEPKVGKNA